MRERAEGLAWYSSAFTVQKHFTSLARCLPTHWHTARECSLTPKITRQEQGKSLYFIQNQASFSLWCVLLSEPTKEFSYVSRSKKKLESIEIQDRGKLKRDLEWSLVVRHHRITKSESKALEQKVNLFGRWELYNSHRRGGSQGGHLHSHAFKFKTGCKRPKPMTISQEKIRRDSRHHPLSECDSDHPTVPTDVVPGTKIPQELDASSIYSHLIQRASTGHINRHHNCLIYQKDKSNLYPNL